MEWYSNLYCGMEIFCTKIDGIEIFYPRKIQRQSLRVVSILDFKGFFSVYGSENSWELFAVWLCRSFPNVTNEDGLYTRVLRLDFPQLNKLGRG
jgi:hypothetical protein